VVIVLPAAERFEAMMKLLGDRAARSLLFAADADYSIELHCWGKNVAGQWRAEVTLLDADDFLPDDREERPCPAESSLTPSARPPSASDEPHAAL
jgi:hypothetical protein